MQQAASESGHAPRSAVLPRLLHHGRSLPSVAWLLIGIALLTTLLALLLVPSRRLAVDAGSGGDARFLAHFYFPETNASTTFRWSSPRARLVLHGSGSTTFADSPATNDGRRLGVPLDALRLTALPTGTPQFVLSSYTHREDAARLSAALGKPLQPIASGPDLPGRNDPAFVVYAPEP